MDELAGGAQLLMGGAWAAAGAPDLAIVSAITRIACFASPQQEGMHSSALRFQDAKTTDGAQQQSSLVLRWCHAHPSAQVLCNRLQEIRHYFTVMPFFCCAAAAGRNVGPDAAVRQQGPEDTMRQEAGVALAYAQLAVLVNERRGPR